MPTAPGTVDSEAVAARVLKAARAILGLFQDTGLQDPQGMVHMENQWPHHGYHAFLGVNTQAATAAAVRGGLLIALRADVFAPEEVQDVVDIVLGKAMVLDVVTAGGTLTLMNVHGPSSGGAPGRLRRPSGLTWPCMRRPRVRDLGHANCPPPYPLAGLHGAIMYPPQKKTRYECCT